MELFNIFNTSVGYLQVDFYIILGEDRYTFCYSDTTFIKL